jgi:membrane-associated phospholipid phosphatase
VAASRLVLGLHWLSDVLVGGALGCALGQLALDLG